MTIMPNHLYRNLQSLVDVFGCCLLLLLPMQCAQAIDIIDQHSALRAQQKIGQDGFVLHHQLSNPTNSRRGLKLAVSEAKLTWEDGVYGQPWRVSGQFGCCVTLNVLD
jgi:hypothetical protein